MEKMVNVLDVINDIRNYGLYEVVDDFEIYDSEGDRLALSIYYECDMVTVTLYLASDEDGFFSGMEHIPFTDFEKYTQKEFDELTSNILFYGMHQQF